MSNSAVLLEQPTPVSHLLSINSDDDFIFIYNAFGLLIVEIDIRLLAEGILNDTWRGAILYDEYTAFFNGIYYEIFCKFKFSKKISNFKNLECSLEDIKEWLHDIYTPKFLCKNLKYNALVVSESMYNQLPINSLMDKIEASSMENQIFTSEEDALLWLISKQDK